MTDQLLIATFVYKTVSDKFAALDPTEHDQIIGYYETEQDALAGLKEFIQKEGIEFISELD
jgi:hypothetical protein